MEYGLIGEHLGHSYSPEIHAKLAPYEYELLELQPAQLQGFIQSRNFKAINVTIPYKESVIPMLDAVDDDARSIGAVNTVVNMGGRLYGYNTDVLGMTALIKRLGLCLEGRKVLILGNGGTAKTARAVAESLGAKDILNVSRHAEGKDAVSYEEAVQAHGDAQIIINATPCGMFPAMDGLAIDISLFPSLEGLVDVIYHPLRTNLILDAQKRGLPAQGGLYMLVAQAVYACGFFLEKRMDARQIDDIYREILADKENIALIGMPSSGKTQVGTLLAQALGREFIDTDEEIVKHIKMPIADYFTAHGEAAFRQEEAVAVAEAAAKSACVIATGGGAILSDDNLRALRRNSRLVFIDRSLDKLISTADRPLSSDREALTKRYEERYPLYLAAADVHINGDGSISEVARLIREALDI